MMSAGDKAIVAEYASKNGILAAIRHFKQMGEFANLTLCGRDAQKCPQILLHKTPRHPKAPVKREGNSNTRTDR
jgi:hypothetical protein